MTCDDKGEKFMKIFMPVKKILNIVSKLKKKWKGGKKLQTRDHEHKKMVDQKHLILLIFFFRCLEGKRDVTKAIKFYSYCYFTAQLLRGCRLASSPLSILTRADHIYCLNFPTDRQLTAPCFVARGMQVGL